MSPGALGQRAGRAAVPKRGYKLGAVGALFLCALPAPAWAAFPSISEPLVVFGAITIGAIALAIATGLWAISEQRISDRLRRSLRVAGARIRAAVGERDALLGAGREALVVWGRDGAGPYSYGGGEALLDACLAGPDATVLSQALDALSDKGSSFTLTVSDGGLRRITARGRAVGGMAAVWMEEQQTVSDYATDFRAILDALPIPVWLRDKTLSLVWGNHAFVEATGAANLDAAKKSQSTLDRTERDLAATARTQNSIVEAKRYSIVGQQRRALAFSEIPLNEFGIVGTAVDVTEISAAEARLQQHIDAHADTLDKLATAVAIFGPDQRLNFYNRAFVQLWGLPEKWLDGKPTDGEVLDRLREDRKLAEQRDYQAWKRERLARYQAPSENASEELWHIPSGKTLRVVAQPHPFGGLTFLYEDVTEKLALESSYNTLIKVQSATLNTLQEGVAVFGLDGRLKLHNAAFTQIWDLDEKDLEAEPHARAVAALCATKFGDSAIWDRLLPAILAGASAKRELGEVERADRSILSLSLSPLPDGAILMTFTDVTDRFRIESALRDRNEALETADRLKSDFIKHVSYELRTPLNTILGFSEHLASGMPGTLNERQNEYVDAIVDGANTLKSLISDILDLSLIESGALRLELEKIDLRVLLDDVAAHARDWAAKVDLTLDVDCPADAGNFLADARRLRQVVFNLLSNAFKYTPRGGHITLSGRIQGEDVQITVADNGPGIAPEVKARVFERFAAKNQGGQRAGAGLGLALVNRFVELHDGWVEIESNNNAGTVVRCHLPRRLHEGPAGGGEDRAVA